MKTKTTKFPFEVYATAFHGGGFVSRHSSLALAKKAVKKYAMTDCSCGCAGIINTQEGEKPGTQSDQDNYSNPYAIGSI